MGQAYSAQLNEFDDFDDESDDDMLDVDMDFEDDIGSYLLRQRASSGTPETKNRLRGGRKSKSGGRSSLNHLPQDWQDFDYGEDDDFIDY